MAERNGFPLKEGSRGSIILREQDGRCRPVCFRDEPKLRPVHGLVGGNDPPALRQCTVVGRTVVVCEVSPIAGLVTLNPQEDVILCDRLAGVRRGNDVAKSEYGHGNCVSFHNPKSSIVAAMPSSSSPRISTSPALRAALSGSGLASLGQAGQCLTSITEAPNSYPDALNISR